MSETATTQSTLREAAQAALDTHDTLQAVHVDEPPMNPDTDLPYDSAGWLAWKATKADPAYAAWKAAMDRLQEVMGEDFPGRHPYSFRPVCEGLVADSTSVDAAARP